MILIWSLYHTAPRGFVARVLHSPTIATSSALAQESDMTRMLTQ